MLLDRAKAILTIEGEAILSLRQKLNESFIKAVEMIIACQGKIIVSGIGKSGLISQKIASTLACTGTPAFFLHPAEGMHGDIGMISKGDVMIAVSNSGETEELGKILTLVKRMGIGLIVICGNLESTLAKSGDVALDVGVKEEACPMGLVPTASTATTMAMGDALAITVLERRGFNADDFAVLHPGGALGRKLLLRVEDLMHVSKQIPLVREHDPLKVVLIEMTSKRFGVTGVCDDTGALTGVITDGDLRRGIENDERLLGRRAKDIMSAAPKTIEKQALAAKALQVMEEHSISSLFVLNANDPRNVEGLIHMHDLLKGGVI